MNAIVNFKQQNIYQMNFTDEDKKLIHETVAKNCTMEELKMFLISCSRYGLNPLMKEAYCIKYGTYPAQMFASRDGFLSIANRNPSFAGLITDHEKVDIPIDIQGKYGKVKRDFQYVAWCEVYRKGFDKPIRKKVMEQEYSTGDNLWVTKPITMIEKVAEAQALKRAFSINGFYSEDEAWAEYSGELKKIKDLEPDIQIMAQRGRESVEKDLNELKSDPTKIADLNDHATAGVEEKRKRIQNMLRLIARHEMTPIFEEMNVPSEERKQFIKDKCVDKLEKISTFMGKDGKEVKGVTSTDELKGKRLQVVYGKIKDIAKEMRLIKDTEPNEEGDNVGQEVEVQEQES